MFHNNQIVTKNFTFWSTHAIDCLPLHNHTIKLDIKLDLGIWVHPKTFHCDVDILLTTHCTSDLTTTYIVLDLIYESQFCTVRHFLLWLKLLYFDDLLLTISNTNNLPINTYNIGSCNYSRSILYFKQFQPKSNILQYWLMLLQQSYNKLL